MKPATLLDSFALIKYLRAEAGAERIRRWFTDAVQQGVPLLVCELNLGELFYVIAKKNGLAKAEEILTVLPTLPLTVLPVTWDLLLHAARLKAQYALSYADCVAVACAVAHHAILATGDPEFKAVQHLVTIEWI